MSDYLSTYPSFQIVLAFMLALILTLAAMPFWIRLLKHRQIGQQVRADGPQGHLVKQGTPTMGGVVILVMMTLSCFVAGWPSGELLSLLVLTLATGLLGLVDDISKVAHGRSLGLTPSQKMAGLTVLAVVFGLVATNCFGISGVVGLTLGHSALNINLELLSFSVFGVQIMPLYLVFVFLMVAGFSNAVNLTDGLDGLAGGTVTAVLFVMAVIAYLSNQLDLAIFAMAAAGACIGFLWFNCYPASIFMGDTGSLALGAAFAGLCILTKNEVVGLIVGALFVVEALSVIIQVAYFKRTRKRIFLMSPLHHHFEKAGWSETKVVIRFWIVSGLLAGLGFALFFAGNMALGFI